MWRLLWLLPLGLTLTPSARVVAQPAGPGTAPGLPAGLEPAVSPGAPPPALYPVTPAAGPWMICAAHYAGPDAPELARQITLVLRNTHNLPAYLFNHADQERLKMRQELQRLQQQYPGVPWRRRTVRVPEECAVLVGGYKDFDSASAALKKVKTLPMPELKLAGGKLAYDTVNVYEPDPEHKAMTIKPYRVNPFSNAMVVRNPTVPAPPKPVLKFDPAWKQFNADEKYSVLENPHRYTLVVKEYHGGTIVPAQPSSGSSGFLKMFGVGRDRPGDRLSASAAQAHELARLLRDPRLGFTAWVLHTRTSSIVTVGGFDRLDDPERYRLQRQITALKFKTSQGGNDPVGLMASPLPMEVPRP
jgi:hypothetical protein